MALVQAGFGKDRRRRLSPREQAGELFAREWCPDELAQVAATVWTEQFRCRSSDEEK